MTERRAALRVVLAAAKDAMNTRKAEAQKAPLKAANENERRIVLDERHQEQPADKTAAGLGDPSKRKPTETEKTEQPSSTPTKGV